MQKGESMKQRILLIAITLIGTPVSMHAVRQILGNNLLTSTFQQTVNCSAFHRPTQSLYVGLSAPTSTTTTTTTGPQVGDYSISRSTPIYDGHVPSFVPLCTTPAASTNTTTTTTPPLNGSQITGQAITGLALMSSSDPLLAQNPLVACLTASPATTLNVLNSTGTQYAVSNALNDSAGAAAIAILQIEASADHIFAAVNGSAAATPSTVFGSNIGDGIALTGVTRSATGLNFTYHNTGTGSTAAPIAVPVSTMVLSTGGAPVVANGFNLVDAGAALGTPVLQNLNGNILDMHYEPTLKKLYVTSHMTISPVAGGNTAGNIACGLVIFDYDDVGDTITRIPQFTLAGLPAANDTLIVATTRQLGVIPGFDRIIVLEKVSVLNSSTGYPYLIVVGEISDNPTYTTAAVANPNAQSKKRNKVFALPLVASATQQGITALPVGTFVGQLANGVGELGAITTTLATGATLAANSEPSVIVGSGGGTNGDLPITNNDPNKGVTWLECIGDTVFVSVAVDVTNATNTGGIFYSQAQFNNFGKIVRWTDWAKAAPNQLGGNAADGSVQSFGLSAISGAMWGVEVGGQNVYRTEWTESGTPVTATSVPLVAALNNNFSNGCFSVFDLNQSINNFGNKVTNRYALFGGQNQVAFALISTAAATTYVAVQNTIISDFSLPANFMMTQLPAGAGPVTVLGYSGGDINNASTQGLFFAGTKNGLYVWAANGGGVGANNATLGNLNTGAFSPTACSWQKVLGVFGEVVAFKTRGAGTVGTSMYVLTRDTSGGTTVVDRLYSMAQASTAAGLIPVLIATSGTAATTLATATLFYDCEVLADSGNPSQEQVILATNNGLYRSTTAGGVQGATNQATALWTLITTPASGSIYNKLNVPDRLRHPSSLIAANWVDDALSEGVYDRTALHQLCFNAAATTILESPTGDFISDTAQPASLMRLTDYWSDGARRFMITFNDRLDYSTDRLNSLQLFPYRTAVTEWNTMNEMAVPLGFSMTRKHSRFNWVHSIGAGGQIMVGTNAGVLSME